MPAPAPERRKTTIIQRVSLALDIGLLTAVASLAFWTGRQAQQIEEMRAQQQEQAKSTASSQERIGSAVARIDVVEAKAESTTELVRSLKEDMTDRLRRIEDKIDGERRGRR